MDIIFENCTIVDGTGDAPYHGDVGIRAGKIAKIGQLTHESATERINTGGQVLCPGFIDIHSHDDISVVFKRHADVKVRQGVTTQVVGNCGVSAAPVLSHRLPDLRQAISIIDTHPEKAWSWQTMEEYFNVVDAEGVSCNLIGLIGHTNLRACFVGFEDRLATPSELSAMQEAIAASMTAGAAGLSTGLIYPPGCYADTDELIALCRVVNEYEGLYATHLRWYDHRLLESVQEAIAIGETAAVPVQISHHVVVGSANWPLIAPSLQLIEAARDRGVDVTLDVYPYAAGSTNLSQLIPPWTHEGGVSKLIERLRSQEVRARIEAETRWWEPDVIMIASVATSSNRRFVGKRLDEIARERGETIIDTLCNLIIEEDNQIGMVAFSQSEENVRLNYCHPLSMLGTDGIPVREFGDGHPHPRAYASCPRLLAQFVRNEKLLSLEEAVRKMTGMPAARLRLRERGLVKEGMAADLVVFDLESLSEEATFADPHHYPKGISYVVVNGEFVISKGTHTGKQPAGVLRLRGGLHRVP